MKFYYTLKKIYKFFNCSFIVKYYGILFFIIFNKYFLIFYFKKPSIIFSSASFSVRPKVINLIICSPAILPIAAS